MRSVFSEDNSSAQPYVLTTSVRRFMAGGRMLLDTNNCPSAMGIATGVPGVGKTVALDLIGSDELLKKHTFAKNGAERRISRRRTRLE